MVEEAFTKIRIKIKKHLKPLDPKINYLMNQRNNLLKEEKRHPENVKKITNIEETISNMETEESIDLIWKKFEQFNDNPENVNLQSVWKVLTNIGPKHGNPMPIAKRNFKGELVSTPSDINKLLAKEYKQRLRPDPGDLNDRQKRKYLRRSLEYD